MTESESYVHDNGFWGKKNPLLTFRSKETRKRLTRANAADLNRTTVEAQRDDCVISLQQKSKCIVLHKALK